MKLLFGLSLSIAFIFLGFHILNNKVENSTNPLLIEIVAYTTIIFFGFWTIIGILGLFGYTSILDKLPFKKSE